MKTFSMNPQQIPLNDDYDVIVVGGGPAGCAASTAAAREGKKTLLIEASSALGGMGTLGLVPFFCGFHDREKVIAKGLAEKVLISCRENTPHLKKTLEAHPFAAPVIDPELLKRIYDNMVIEAGVDILFNTQMCKVEMNDLEQVDAIIVSNKQQLTAYKADVFIDCTGDGDLAAWAGAEFEKGDENGDMQPATHCFSICNVDDYAYENGIPLKAGYDSIIRKAFRSEDYPLIEDIHCCCIKIGPGVYGFNAGHLFDIDCTDTKSMTENLLKGRQLAYQYYLALKKYHPAFMNSYLCATGSILGVRESRRIIGNYTATLDDYRNTRSFDDEICRCAYGADVHSGREESIAVSNMNEEDYFKFIESVMLDLNKGESFGLPYRCLTPKDLKNVLVAGRCISTDRRANGSVRIMACCLNTGEAAGIAAAMAFNDGNNIHDVDIKLLRDRLRQHGGYLP